MRCAKCHEIWKPTALDQADQTKHKSKNIQKMFKHMSQKTDSLFEMPKIQTVEKVRVVKVTHYKYTINLTLLIMLLLSLGSILYYMRYDLVGTFPELEKFYAKLGLNSVSYGEHLEFNNISTKEFSQDSRAKIELTGFIYNNGKNITKIPPVRIDIYDSEGKIISSRTETLPLRELSPGYNMMFKVILDNPTAYNKSIYLNFKDKS